MSMWAMSWELSSLWGVQAGPADLYVTSTGMQREQGWYSACFEKSTFFFVFCSTVFLEKLRYI